MLLRIQAPTCIASGLDSVKGQLQQLAGCVSRYRAQPSPLSPCQTRRALACCARPRTHRRRIEQKRMAAAKNATQSIRGPQQHAHGSPHVYSQVSNLPHTAIASYTRSSASRSDTRYSTALEDGPHHVTMAGGKKKRTKGTPEGKAQAAEPVRGTPVLRNASAKLNSVQCWSWRALAVCKPGLPVSRHESARRLRDICLCSDTWAPCALEVPGQHSGQYAEVPDGLTV